MKLKFLFVVVVLLYLVGCQVSEPSQKEIDEAVEGMSDEELESIVKSDDSSTAVAGKAIEGRMGDVELWKISAANQLYERASTQKQKFEQIILDNGGCFVNTQCSKGLVCINNNCVYDLPSDIQLPNGCVLLDKSVKMIPPNECKHKKCSGFEDINGSVWTYSKNSDKYCIKQQCVEDVVGNNVIYGPFKQIFCQ